MKRHTQSPSYQCNEMLHFLLPHSQSTRRFGEQTKVARCGKKSLVYSGIILVPIPLYTIRYPLSYIRMVNFTISIKLSNLSRRTRISCLLQGQFPSHIHGKRQPPVSKTRGSRLHIHVTCTSLARLSTSSLPVVRRT